MSTAFLKQLCFLSVIGVSPFVAKERGNPDAEAEAEERSVRRCSALRRGRRDGHEHEHGHGRWQCAQCEPGHRAGHAVARCPRAPFQSPSSHSVRYRIIYVQIVLCSNIYSNYQKNYYLIDVINS